ncbi:MAG: hypothetical protein RBQ97_03700 [Acholeplasma sp.]|nr:hypothetical protein [Acholeplasma sp.]
MIKKKKTKRETPRVGDVHVTSNFRLKNYNKGKNDGRMTVLTLKDKKGNQTVNAIVGAESKDKLKDGYVSINKDRNRFLKKKSVVSLEKHTTVYSKKSEIKKGASKTQKIDVTNKDNFGKRIGKIHWKDKKQVKKALQ